MEAPASARGDICGTCVSPDILCVCIAAVAVVTVLTVAFKQNSLLTINFRFQEGSLRNARLYDSLSSFSDYSAHDHRGSTAQQEDHGRPGRSPLSYLEAV